jgi:hypothetical protein
MLTVLVPVVYPRSPEAATTARSGVQLMWKPGMEKLFVTIWRSAALPAKTGAPGMATRASSVQNASTLSGLPPAALTCAQARSVWRRLSVSRATSTDDVRHPTQRVSNATHRAFAIGTSREVSRLTVALDSLMRYGAGTTLGAAGRSAHPFESGARSGHTGPFASDATTSVVAVTLACMMTTMNRLRVESTPNERS